MSTKQGHAPGLVPWDRTHLVLPTLAWCLGFPHLPGLYPSSTELSRCQRELSGIFQVEAQVVITATSRQPGVEITGHLVPCTLTCPLGRGSEAPAPLVRRSGKALVNLGWAMSLGRVVSTGGVGGGWARMLPWSSTAPMLLPSMEMRGDGYLVAGEHGLLPEASHYIVKRFLVFN